MGMYPDYEVGHTIDGVIREASEICIRETCPRKTLVSTQVLIGSMDGTARG